MTTDDRLLDLLKQEAAERARKSLLAFTLFTKPDYQVNWHHRLLCRYLNRFARGEIRRLMVFMPPRHGKSELVSRRLPAYLLGMNPNLQIITASYSDSLASQMNRDAQRIIDSDDYRRVFPKTVLGNGAKNPSSSTIRNADFFEVVGHKGRYKSAGIGTGITGMGADLAIIDDPVKDQNEADSVTYRERAWEWYSSTLYTRLEKQGSILITMTRWHEDDLAGRILSQAKADAAADQWEVLSLPAVCEDEINTEDPRKMGDTLWPDKYSIETMKAVRASSGSRVWNALYQQRPSAMEGGLVKRSWLKFYDQLPDELDEVILSADLTYKDGVDNDFTVIACWARKGVNIYLVDQIRERMDFPAQITALREMSNRYPDAFVKYIEEAANGAAIISLLKSEIIGLVPYKPMTSKEARLAAVSPLFEAGNVFYPNPVTHRWVDINLHEILTFPNDVHDDTVDATSMALQQLGRLGSSISKLDALAKW